MRVLLDTHVALWWFNDAGRLDPAARSLLEDAETTAYLSAASVWEAGLKAATGRLTIPTPLVGAAERTGVFELHVGWEHARRATDLPLLHGDPFDRMLVAQALVEGLVLMTRDSLVTQYDVVTLPA